MVVEEGNEMVDEEVVCGYTKGMQGQWVVMEVDEGVTGEEEIVVVGVVVV